jgi:hypothetical protein
MIGIPTHSGSTITNDEGGYSVSGSDRRSDETAATSWSVLTGLDLPEQRDETLRDG